jgi:hypothetical protein
MLATANLRLHKIASNDANVTQAFPSEDRASELYNLDLNNDTKPIQRSLGVYWDLETDTFTFKVSEGNKPFTRRGVLSVINSLFDPLRIVSPVIIKGKMLLRTMSPHLKNRQLVGWDEQLPEEHNPAWMEWCQSLSNLQHLKISRSYTLEPLAETSSIVFHVFCGASIHGIAAVCYNSRVVRLREGEISPIPCHNYPSPEAMRCCPCSRNNRVNYGGTSYQTPFNNLLLGQ